MASGISIRELKSESSTPFVPLNIAPWPMPSRSMYFFGEVGNTLPWYQLTRIGPRQSLAGCSKCASSFTGVTSGLNGSPLASTAVG